MDFAFTEEQELMRATVREFCEKEITSEKIREWEETLDFMPQEVWDKAAAMGLFAASVPEEYGGEGADMVTAMVGFEEISKASTAVALGVGATIGFGTRPIVELGHRGAEEGVPAPDRRGQAQVLARADRAGGRHRHPGSDIHLRRLRRRRLRHQRAEDLHHRRARGRLPDHRGHNRPRQPQALPRALHHPGAGGHPGRRHPPHPQGQHPLLRLLRGVLRQRAGAEEEPAGHAQQRLVRRALHPQPGAHRGGHDIGGAGGEGVRGVPGLLQAARRRSANPSASS